jgi:hypothetical protein
MAVVWSQPVGIQWEWENPPKVTSHHFFFFETSMSAGPELALWGGGFGC